MSLTYASTLVCPLCKCGVAVQIKPDLVTCPSCGYKFKLVKVKGDAKAEKR